MKHIYDDPLSPESTIIPDKGFGATPGFKTAADAIAAGVDPKSTDLADLAGKRVQRNQSAIAQKAFQDGMSTMKADDGKPILGPGIESASKLNADGSVSTTQKIPDGYKAVQAGDNVLTVHKDYAPILEGMYRQSAFRQNALGNALLNAAAFAKHGSIMVDTYHAARTLMREVTGFQTAGWGKGLAGLDYAPGELDRAVKAGKITQTEADYARAHAAHSRPVAPGRAEGRFIRRQSVGARRTAQFCRAPPTRGRHDREGESSRFPTRYNEG